MTEKTRRQSALLQLIRSRRVGTHRQIIEQIRRGGLSVTQASISRDIRELGIVKLGGRYVPAGEAVADISTGKAADPVLGLVTGVETAGANLVVIKTRIGAAGSVAAALDKRLAEEAAGTLAGDDTIFVAVGSRAHQGRVVALMNRWMLSRERRTGTAGRRAEASGKGKK